MAITLKKDNAQKSSQLVSGGKLTGCKLGVWGDASNAYGDVSLLSGDITGISGDVSRISGTLAYLAPDSEGTIEVRPITLDLNHSAVSEYLELMSSLFEDSVTNVGELARALETGAIYVKIRRLQEIQALREAEGLNY